MNTEQTAAERHEAALVRIATLTKPGQELDIHQAIDLICDVWTTAAEALSPGHTKPNRGAKSGRRRSGRSQRRGDGGNATGQRIERGVIGSGFQRRDFSHGIGRGGFKGADLGGQVIQGLRHFAYTPYG